ncbi:MAG: LptF/LptG family permease [Planctomycetes bacterium]|nr:LptF/LptG family permease [Planctomycetota bacterium]
MFKILFSHKIAPDHDGVKQFTLTEPPRLPYLAVMCIMDRYLLRQFFKTFAICFLSLTGLYIVFDVFTNMEEFVRCGRKVGGVIPFIAHYYSYQTILFFDRTSGLLVLISAMFTVSWIQRHNEMTALMSAGVSRIRVLAPIIVAVVVVGFLTAANRELVIPRYRDELSRHPQNPLGDQARPLEPRYDGQTDVLLGGRSTFSDQKRIEEPSFFLPPALRRYGNHLRAENAYYKRPEGNRPGGYLLDGVYEPKNLDGRPSLLLAGRPVLITPLDASDRLEPDQCFLVSNVDFDLLLGGGDYTQLSSTAELIRGLRNPSLGFGADVRVAIHSRIVQPLMDITLLFLGLPLIVSRESRNVFIAMGVCMAVTTMFWLVAIGAQHLGDILLIDPSLAAWVPLMIFVPVAAGLAESMWK